MENASFSDPENSRNDQFGSLQLKDHVDADKGQNGDDHGIVGNQRANLDKRKESSIKRCIALPNLFKFAFDGK